MKTHFELPQIGRPGLDEEFRQTHCGYKPVWVAKITGECPKFGLSREFVSAKRDYTWANKDASKGVTLNYILDDGFYEVSERIRGTENRRYFIKVKNGTWQEVEWKEVQEWLKKAWG